MFFNPEVIFRTAANAHRYADTEANNCSQRLFDIVNNPIYNTTFDTLFISTGKSPNDLGNFERCISDTTLEYALVTITGDQYRQRIQMGLCIPKECTEESLKTLFNKLYMQGIAYTKIMQKPN